MNKFFKIFIKFMLCMSIIVLFKTNTFAAGFINFVSSGHTDKWGYAIPQNDPGGEAPIDPKDYPKIWGDSDGEPYIPASRFMLTEGGTWDYADQNGSLQFANRGTNPGVWISFTKDINASDFSLTKFTGYTLVPDSAFGAKPEKQTANTSGGLTFPGDLGRIEPINGDIRGWEYLLQGIDGDPNYWANNWDFWRSGWNADQGCVTVTFSSNDTVAHITRKNFLGSTGYVNWPLYNNYFEPGHEEWLGRFGIPPDQTLVSSSVIDRGVEHRYYGIGEKVYLYGTHTAPPPPSTNNINFYLSIEDPDKIDSTNWSRSAVTYTKSKSGYGIPLVAEIRGFNYVPHVTAQGQMSYYTNFRIQNDSSVYISSTSLDKIPQTNFDFITSKINGYDEYARYFLPVNPNSPLNMRKIYSSVNQQNGTYSLTVTAHAHTTWDEWTYEWWYNTGYPDYIDVYHWVDTPQNTWYDNSQSVTIDIQGSMFDDDSQTVGQ